MNPKSFSGKPSRGQFVDLINQLVAAFPKNAFIQKLERGEITMESYHSLLRMIFHQTFEGPTFLALAAAHCDKNQVELKSYLIHHAEEEKNHWNWILNDLKATGYKGPDPRSEFPPTACQAYNAFNFYVAVHYPLARLGIAVMLESLGAIVGSKYVPILCKKLSLKPSETVFFSGHTETDVGHTDDIWKLLDSLSLNETDWSWLYNAAQTAFRLYFQMYEEVAKAVSSKTLTFDTDFPRTKSA